MFSKLYSSSVCKSLKIDCLLVAYRLRGADYRVYTQRAIPNKESSSASSVFATTLTDWY